MLSEIREFVAPMEVTAHNDILTVSDMQNGIHCDVRFTSAERDMPMDQYGPRVLEPIAAALLKRKMLG